MVKLAFLLGVVLIIVLVHATCVKSASLLKHENQPLGNTNKYRFAYSIDDGQERTEEGSFEPDANGIVKQVVTGSYKFTAPDGVTYIVSYTADENGYHQMTMTIKPILQPAISVGLSPNAIKSLIG